MKKIVSFLLILLAFDISSNAQNVDLSSVDEFLNITALLKNGEEVNMEQWNQLDRSAAYSIFQFQRQYYSQYSEGCYAGCFWMFWQQGTNPKW